MKRLHAQRVPVCPGTRTRAWLVAFVTTIVFLTTSGNSFALEPVREPGSDKILTGLAFTIAGGLTAGIGMGVYIATENSGQTARTTCAPNQAIFPAALMVVGGAMFLAGATVGIIGQVERSRAYAPKATLTIGPFGGSFRVLF